MLAAAALAVVLLVLSALPAGAREGTSAGQCRRGTVRAVISGRNVCLKAGKKCTWAVDWQYHRYGFHCHTGRLSRKATLPRPRDVTLTPSGRAHVVFDWTRDRCAENDIPDTPARAFRDAKGRVQLIATQDTGRRFIGRDFRHLAHPCGVIMESGLGPDPATFDNYEFITATWTPDGKTVYALVHNEFRGDLVPGQCPSGSWLGCWYNTITLAASTDSGRHYIDHPWPKLVASVPYRYVPDTGPMLAFNPSNIIRNPHDGYFYATVHRTPLAQIPGDSGGTCLMRARHLADPSDWRAWSGGTTFETTFVDPYGSNPEPEQHVCRIDQSAQLYAPSLTYNTVARQWLLVGGGPDGAYYSLSRNLVDWSRPRLVFRVPRTDNYTCSGKDPGAYFSLIDPASNSRNFETSGRTAYVYYTVFHPNETCGLGFDRDLVRIPVRIQR